jgi:hypothetical protein
MKVDLREFPQFFGVRFVLFLSPASTVIAAALHSERQIQNIERPDNVADFLVISVLVQEPIDTLL